MGTGFQWDLTLKFMYDCGLEYVGQMCKESRAETRRLFGREVAVEWVSYGVSACGASVEAGRKYLVK